MLLICIAAAFLLVMLAVVGVVLACAEENYRLYLELPPYHHRQMRGVPMTPAEVILYNTLPDDYPVLIVCFFIGNIGFWVPLFLYWFPGSVARSSTTEGLIAFSVLVTIFISFVLTLWLADLVIKRHNSRVLARLYGRYPGFCYRSNEDLDRSAA